MPFYKKEVSWQALWVVSSKSVQASVPAGHSVTEVKGTGNRRKRDKETAQSPLHWKSETGNRSQPFSMQSDSNLQFSLSKLHSARETEQWIKKDIMTLRNSQNAHSLQCLKQSQSLSRTLQFKRRKKLIALGAIYIYKKIKK